MWPFSPSYPERSIGTLYEEYDYVVVGEHLSSPLPPIDNPPGHANLDPDLLCARAGGGTAGCAIANRLSASANTRVLLVERGPVADTWAARVPLFSSDFASDGSRTIKRTTVPQSELVGASGVQGDRAVEAYTGAVLGGTSRINQMLYTRGLPDEYNRWETEAGMKGWGWDEMKAYFLKSEKSEVAIEGVHSQGGVWRNKLHTSFYFKGFSEYVPSTLAIFLPLTCPRAIEAAKSIGLPYIPDLNSPSNPPFGCARLHFTIDENSHRHSSYHAFLPKDLALARQEHLHICTNTIVERLETKRTTEGELVVTGVVLGPREEAKSSRKSVRARKEVILSAGPFGSPQVLMVR